MMVLWAIWVVCFSARVRVPCRGSRFVAAVLAVVIPMGMCSGVAVASPTGGVSVSAASAPQGQSEVLLTEEQVRDLRAAAGRIVGEAQDRGDVSSREAHFLRGYLVDGTTTNRVLPAWAVGALAGCAIDVLRGPVKGQVKELLKTGKTDAASRIAADAAVDCVFGAIPGGAATAAAKKAITDPLKKALRPHVKAAIEKLRGVPPAPPRPR